MIAATHVNEIIPNILGKSADSYAHVRDLHNPDHHRPMIAVSKSSVCTSAFIKPFHALIAISFEEFAAFSAIHFSLGKFDNEKETERALNVSQKTRLMQRDVIG
jgi:cysteine sulfinate desulfinase/cysteine desulfurase-like protein